LFTWTRRAATAQGLPYAVADPSGNPRPAGYEYVRAGTCSVRGSGTQGRAAGYRPPGQARLCGLRPVSVRTGQCHGASPPSGHGQPQYPFPQCFEEVLGLKEAKAFLRRVVFHHTPKHASWLNMAGIEIGILDRQCLNRRLPNRATLVAEVDAWQQRRNADQRGIAWSFSRQDADKKNCSTLCIVIIVSIYWCCSCLPS